MADTRKARRDAEKAAREALSGTLVGVAGDLGAALAGQHEAAEATQAARTKGAAIVEAARHEAAALVNGAEREAATAAETYASAWNAAKEAGRTPAQLRSMGYTKPPAVRRAPSGNPPAATTEKAGEASAVAGAGV